MAMVTPRSTTQQRLERHRALAHWDGLLHDTLSELRDALERVKELDKADAQPHPPQNPR